MENLEQHLGSIVLEALPQTIIDAVEVCWELHIPYLWVDSLCIIQARDGMTLEEDSDARKDWEEEGSKMQDAYGNSWLTIYAEDATCCTAGFLKDCKFQFATCKSDFDQEVSDDSSHEYTEPLERKGSVLTSRGWCLQEYLASNRRLRFYEAEMVWECNRFYRCQCTHMDSHEPDDKFLEIRGQEKAEASFKDYFSTWCKIVEDYSDRQVADPNTNKLQAISAVANIIAARTGDQYLKGLWRGKIPDGLAWETLPKRPLSEYTSHAERAPTWSWASIDGPVKYAAHPSRTSSHNMVRRPNTTYVTYNQTDSSISLKLKGPLLTVRLASRQNEDLRPDVEARPQTSDKVWTVIMDFDNVDGILKLESSQAKTCWERGSCQCQPDISCMSNSGQFFALRLHTWEDETPRKDRSHRGRDKPKPRIRPEVWFLVLKEIREKTSTYERIGIGHHDGLGEWTAANEHQVTLM